MPKLKTLFQLDSFIIWKSINITHFLLRNFKQFPSYSGPLCAIPTRPSIHRQNLSDLILELGPANFYVQRSSRLHLIIRQYQELHIMPDQSLTSSIEDEVQKKKLPSATSSSTDVTHSIKPKPYQQEMFEESLKHNIIVAMDTGSGKTHIALMRIKYELERMPQHQLIWFLAPTISLCAQQFEYFKSYLPSAQVRFLSGADEVDRWTEQYMWDKILKNINIVVSTHQILLDALVHGFVKIESLALLVLDEAHNCVGKNPGAKIMNLFYHPQKALGKYVPHILGLTASPVMGSKLDSLAKIETTLDSLARTPTKHRLELRTSVKLPVLENIPYVSSFQSSHDITESVSSLEHLCLNLEITNDPFYVDLLGKTDPKSIRKLENLRRTQKTWSHDMIKTLFSTSIKIFDELGPWASDYYISEVVSKAICYSKEKFDTFGVWEEGLHDLEKKYLIHLLGKVHITEPSSHIVQGMPNVSDKVFQMIQFLIKQKNDFSGIVFVRERAVVACLAKLLAIHPHTRDKIRAGTMVGISSFHRRARQVFDLIDTDSQINSLPDFRSGKINLLIGTSVLEEGIDIPSCNSVVCFQKPENLKSYIQRRGRARKVDSKLVLLRILNECELSQYEQLEQEMRAIYEDETRTLEESADQIDADEELESAGRRQFKIENTGALLEIDHAVAHLHHFCSSLPSDKYIDTRPDFICTRDSEGRFQAQIILPISVHESVRIAKSLQGWLNEKNAIKDAAFEAYVALYKAGLISDNLLPLKSETSLDIEFQSAVETRLSVIKIQQMMNPWVDIAKSWSTRPDIIYRSTIKFEGQNIDLFLPVPFPKIPTFKVYWDEKTEISISFGPQLELNSSSKTLKELQEETNAFIQAAFPSEKLKVDGEFVIKLLANQEIPLKQQLGTTSIPETVSILHKTRLIRDHQGVGYFFKELLPEKPDIKSVKNPDVNYERAPTNVAYLSLVRIARRTDFMHPIMPRLNTATTYPHSIVMPITKCRMDKMPFKLVQFAYIIPCVMRQMELNLIASKLSESLLNTVNISDLYLVLTAICSSSAGEITNYQRLEFLGDNILKFCTSIQIAGENPLWPESNLSRRKDHIVANSRLSRAAVEFGLDKYIVTKRFTSLKWHATYVDDLLNMEQNVDREISTKTLADVIESLIGASMLDGGLPKAISCIKLFLPELKWDPIEKHRLSIFERAPSCDIGDFYSSLQTLLGYNFKKPSLLIEAITHASYISGLCSFERLEFLGDSILDFIIVQEMYPFGLSHMRMHELRTAFVNADLLAFFCLKLHYNREIHDLKVFMEQPNSQQINLSPVYQCKQVSTLTKVPLYCFMRHDSEGIRRAQAETNYRYEKLWNDISYALEIGPDYPWAALCGLKAEKFYSDMIEALLAAIWVDSGSLQVVSDVVERMGILKLLRRAITEGVNTEHPKVTLGKLADKSEVRFQFSEETDSTDGPDWMCTVLIDEEEVANVRGGISKLEMQTRAAIKAIHNLHKKAENSREALKRSHDQKDQNNFTIDKAPGFITQDW